MQSCRPDDSKFTGKKKFPTSNFQFLHNPLLTTLKTRWSVSVYYAGTCRVLLHDLPAFSTSVKATDKSSINSLFQWFDQHISSFSSIHFLSLPLLHSESQLCRSQSHLSHGGIVGSHPVHHTAAQTHVHDCG